MTDRRDDKPTVALDPRTITGPTWPVVLATLEQLAPFGTAALRKGLAVMLWNTAHAMAQDDADPELVVKAQALLDALRHMPWS